MPPLSSTKHGHGTEVMALRGEKGAFSSPHHSAGEGAPQNRQAASLAALSLHRLCSSFLSHNCVLAEMRRGSMGLSSTFPPCTPPAGLRWQREGAVPRSSAPSSPPVQPAERLTEVNLRSKDYRLEDWLTWTELGVEKRELL